MRAACLSLAVPALAMIAAGACASEGEGRGVTRPCADVALVLAIDASGSIDAVEYRLQQLGYAEAFRDANVQAALRAAGKVDVAAVIWGDSDFSPDILPFQRIETAGDADSFALRLMGIRRTATGNTGLGNGLSRALDLLESGATCAARRIIDVSGDGRQGHYRGRYATILPQSARKRAEEMGVTINALAITSREPDLEDYYRDIVITGAGAFVARAEGFHDFGDVLIEKLMRELLAGLPASASAPALAAGNRPSGG